MARSGYRLAALRLTALLWVMLLSSVAQARDLYLEVFINGVSTEYIAAFRETPDGRLAGDALQLDNVGISTRSLATDADGMVNLQHLQGVSFRYDEATQSIHFEAVENARSERKVSAVSAAVQRPQPDAALTGALVNYSLLAGAGGGDATDIFTFEGLSGQFEPRIFGRFGVISGSFVAQTDDEGFYGSRRLDTTWSYSDVDVMRSYTAGDLITGGLSWTRPVRLGGVQISRDFGLRPDLVTFPIPAISGSAAVPSSVEVYIDNARRYSGDVPAGPFRITDLPVVTGSGTARLVVRDAQGQEVVSDSAFFATGSLLAPGLFDYSVEAGFARLFYGVNSFDYDDRLMGSATFRYGWNDWLTVEGHVEGGEDLLNGGAGVVFGLGPFGVASLAAAGSTSSAGQGMLAAASLEFDIFEARISGRMQRSFGEYDDIASVTAAPFTDVFDDIWLLGLGRPARAIDQLAVSLPLPFDDSFINFNYTRLETALGDETALLGATYSRSILKHTNIFASGFTSLNDDAFGAFVGLTVPIGQKVSVTASASAAEDGTYGTIDAIRPEGWETGDYGWRIRAGQGSRTIRDLAGSYRGEYARVAATVSQFDDRYDATINATGSIVAAGGGVFATNWVDDAFAIVDIGAPGVVVSHENRPVGTTGPGGRMIVPRLRSYEVNAVSIDPSALPVDAMVEATNLRVTPPDRSGVLVDFGVEAAPMAALVEFVHGTENPSEPIPVGTVVSVAGVTEDALVGYDGQAYVTGLSARNDATLQLPDGRRCRAQFFYAPSPGEQVVIDQVVCAFLEEF
ncbi:fimbrial biogenesis outer membrane usher protein [Aureimonas fodinaquatilis]|uniref:Fimbrial biogenesis outer membrane usher protein n=1 Tax=Aureimonas fodinaquatilis TaxID=2565783 RepID=A0A5B0DUW8_9HYPH|nr:fimbria/pilus outer membrane usher protein [Aureimonas fodinaquatilis]KAA0970607.1 fimbrial biogenesis outer membrane usher protein [Aureimonas fodinaquatilis]